MSENLTAPDQAGRSHSEYVRIGRIRDDNWLDLQLLRPIRALDIPIVAISNGFTIPIMLNAITLGYGCEDRSGLPDCEIRGAPEQLP